MQYPGLKEEVEDRGALTFNKLSIIFFIVTYITIMRSSYKMSNHNKLWTHYQTDSMSRSGHFEPKEVSRIRESCLARTTAAK